jgi:hypothetical protein
VNGVAADRLDASISGAGEVEAAGTVEYIGDPRVAPHLPGAASIRKR